MGRSIIVFGFLLLLISCSKEISIEQPGYESKVVVDGWISNDNYAYVILTKSSPFLTNYDSAAIRNTFLNYAKVTLTSSNGESEILTLFRREEFFPPFVYRSVDIKGEAGLEYQLTIEVEGNRIESNTSIPDPPKILKVNMHQSSDTTMYISADIEDDGGGVDYYYSQIKIIGVDRNFHSSAFPLFNDVGKNGEVFTKNIYRSVEPDPLGLNSSDSSRNLPVYEFYDTDTIGLRISALDQASFNVLSDIYMDQQNSSNPFSFINKSTSSNINGGIGRWTGMGTVEFILAQ